MKFKCVAILAFLCCCACTPQKPIEEETDTSNDGQQSPISSNEENTNSGNVGADIDAGPTINIDRNKIFCDGATGGIERCVNAAKQLIDSITSHQYLRDGFAKINSGRPFPSLFEENRAVDIYTNLESKSYYNLIDPKVSFSNIEVPQGTQIIREVWTPNNRIQKLTVMVRAERGFYPEGGDFFYAELYPNGELIRGGQLAECADCHSIRKNDGWLFGVQDLNKDPDDNQDDNNTIPSIPTPQTYTEFAQRIIKEQRHLSVSFLKVNSISFPSETSNGSYVHIYVSIPASEEYVKVDRNAVGSEVIIPEGSVFIREFKSIDDEIQRYTFMIKGPEGYNPSGGDFYYGVFEPNGDVQVLGGEAQEGKIASCGTCHTALRENDGYLFGVSEEHR